MVAVQQKRNITHANMFRRVLDVSFLRIKRHFINVFLYQSPITCSVFLAGGLGTRFTQCFFQTGDRLSLRLTFSINRGVRIRLYLFRFVKGIDNNRILFFLAGDALLHGRFVQATAGYTGQQMFGSTGLFVRWVSLDLLVGTKRWRTFTGALG